MIQSVTQLDNCKSSCELLTTDVVPADHRVPCWVAKHACVGCYEPRSPAGQVPARWLSFELAGCEAMRQLGSGCVVRIDVSAVWRQCSPGVD